MMKRLYQIIRAILVGSILILIAACGVINPPGPEETVEKWYEAVSKGDATELYKLTHSDRQAALELAITDPLRMVVRLSGIDKRECFNMSYKAVKEEGDSVLIHVTGRCTNQLGFLSNIDEMIELHKEYGKWYIWSVEGWF